MNRGFIGALSLSMIFVLFAGCGGSQSPIPTAGAVPQGRAIAQVAGHGKSWMLAGAKSQNLLYLSVVDGPSGFINVYSYSSRKLVGQLTGLIAPLDECTDSSGNVFVVAAANASGTSSTIYEYAHGGASPIATLADPGVGIGCSIDPVLAVGNSYDPYSKSQGSVAVFSSAQGTATMYYSSVFVQFGACGYDNQGNLYLQGWLPSRQIGLAKLPKSSSSINPITLNAQIYIRGSWIPSVQWDGDHMTVSSFPAHGTAGELLVYRLAFSGSSATVVGTTKLLSHKHVGHDGQSWISGSAIVGVESTGNFGKITYWKYPAGGKYTAMIKRAVDRTHGTAWGLTVSLAPHRSSPRSE